MSKALTPRRMKLSAGLAVLSVLTLAPMAAQAADTTATGTLTAGSLTNSAPAITAFGATLTGVTQTVTTAVGASQVVDARGSNLGYVVTVAASVPTVGLSASAAGTGGSLTLTPRTGVAAAGNPAASGPVAATSPVLLSTTAATIQTAAADTGQGAWDFPADAGAQKSLSVVVPGDASAGAYSSTLTYTAAPPAV